MLRQVQRILRPETGRYLMFTRKLFLVCKWLNACRCDAGYSKTVFGGGRIEMESC